MGNPPTAPTQVEILLREAIANLNSTFSNIYEERYGQGNIAANTFTGYNRNYGRGEDPFVYKTIWELWAAQYHSRLLCRYNEFAIGAIENRVNYITGEGGYSIEVQPRFPDDVTATALARQVQEFLDIFSEVNSCAEMQSESMLRSDEDGEWFIRLFYRRDGMTELRFIEPEHVISKLGDVLTPEFSFGIETDTDDICNVKAYWINEKPYISSTPVRVEENEVVHGKFNSRSSAKRGYPSFLPVGPNLRRCEDLLQSLTQVARTRAKIALIRKLTGVDSTTANRLVQNVTLTRRQRYNSEGTPSNVEDFKDGSILTTGQNSDYIYPDFTFGAADFVEVLQAELRAIATRFQMPEWMFTALADAKYNNAFVVESPALKSFARLQTRQQRLWITGRVGPKRSIYWRAIVWAVKKGILPEEVIRRLKLVAKGPTLVSRDKKQEADINIAYKNAGLKDDTAIQREQGFDPDEVASNKVTEFKEGRMKFDLPTMQAVRGFLEEIATGSLEESTGYKFVSGVLGLPIDVVKEAFPVKPGSKQPPPEPPQGGDGEQTQLREQFKESDHPRDDQGRFVSDGDIEAAKNDPKKAAELRAKVTDSEQRAKLDKRLEEKSIAKETKKRSKINNKINTDQISTNKDTPSAKLSTITSGTKLTSENIYQILSDDPRPVPEVLADIASRAMHDTSFISMHGALDMVEAESLELDGMRIYFETDINNSETKHTNLANVLVSLLYADELALAGEREYIPTPLPKAFSTVNNKILFTAQRNSQDHVWEKAYGIQGFMSAASGGDGNIVFYNIDQKLVNVRQNFAHESGHNLATAVWGRTQPPPDSEYGMAQIQESAVSEYAANSPDEDFAEACKLYVSNKEYLIQNFPKKFAALDKLMKQYGEDTNA